MSATAIAISAATTSNAVAVAAAAEAHAAQVKACQAFMPSFVDASASVEAKRFYASCVQIMLPSPPLDDESRWALKGWIICVILGMAIGVWLSRNDFFFDGISGKFMAALLGALGGFLIPVAVVGVVSAVKFLFS